MVIVAPVLPRKEKVGGNTFSVLLQRMVPWSTPDFIIVFDGFTAKVDPSNIFIWSHDKGFGFQAVPGVRSMPFAEDALRLVGHPAPQRLRGITIAD